MFIICPYKVYDNIQSSVSLMPGSENTLKEVAAVEVSSLTFNYQLYFMEEVLYECLSILGDKSKVTHIMRLLCIVVDT